MLILTFLLFYWLGIIDLALVFGFIFSLVLDLVFFMLSIPYPTSVTYLTHSEPAALSNHISHTFNYIKNF